MMKELPRIRFSTNDRAAVPNSYGLWLPQSVQDLEQLGESLVEGLRVIIYEAGELEMEAVLRFDSAFNAWVAVGDFSTVTHYSQ